MRVRGRTLRTALLATMLVPAMAVPATAAPSAPSANANTAAAATAVDTPAARTFPMKERSYRFRTSAGRDYTLIQGRATMVRHGRWVTVRVRGPVHKRGEGCTGVTILQSIGADTLAKSFRLCKGRRSIDFQQRYPVRRLSRNNPLTIFIIANDCDLRGKCKSSMHTMRLTK
jgi:hypothetical protein